jgi:hypothetical protein
MRSLPVLFSAAGSLSNDQILKSFQVLKFTNGQIADSRLPELPSLFSVAENGSQKERQLPLEFILEPRQPRIREKPEAGCKAGLQSQDKLLIFGRAAASIPDCSSRRP